MRSLALALLVLALTATPASAAVIEFEDRSSPEDNEPTIAIIVRAAPGETNMMTVRPSPGGIVIEDAGAPLTGECEPSGGGRFCRGRNFGTVDVFLGDGNDTLDHRLYGGDVNAGDGDDDVRLTNGSFTFAGGVGDDDLEAGPETYTLYGGDGDDVLTGSAERNYLGGAGDDQLLAGDGSDSLAGDAGADVLECQGAAPFIDADAGDRLAACAPTPVIHARGPMRKGRRRGTTVSTREPPPSR